MQPSEIDKRSFKRMLGIETDGTHTATLEAWPQVALTLANWLFTITNHSGTICVLLATLKEDLMTRLQSDRLGQCAVINNRYFILGEKWFDLFYQRETKPVGDDVVVSSVFDFGNAYTVGSVPGI